MGKQERDYAQGEQPVKARQVPLIGAETAARDTGAGWRPIVDYSEIFPGNRGVNRDGDYELYDAPVGVKLMIEEADKSEILIRADREWEGFGQIIPMAYWTADGKHHMLYGAWDRRKHAKPGMLGDPRKCTCYAVSDDAYHWTKPELNLVEFEGSTSSNMISHFIPGVPFQDPTAPPQERFRVIGQDGGCFDHETGEKLSSEEASRRFEGMEREGEKYKGPKLVVRHWIIGLTSPDGIHWNRIEKHLAEMPSDGGSAASYDPETKTYFAYLRTGGMGRRATGLSRTSDFWDWPAPELVLFPDPQDDPQDSFYSVNYFPYPGRNDLHGMLVAVYHQRSDTVDGQVAFSRDLIHWYRPQRRPIVPLGGPGSGEEGMMFTSQTGLNILPDGDWGVLCWGSSMLHNAGGYITVPPCHIRWARWRPHRLCGIVAEDEGRFTIPTVKRMGNRLRLNCRCKLGGYVKVELIPTIPSRLHPDALGIQGFTFDDCDKLTGDSLDGEVTWRGNADTTQAGDAFAIRVKMFQAKLFAYAT